MLEHTNTVSWFFNKPKQEPINEEQEKKRSFFQYKDILACLLVLGIVVVYQKLCRIFQTYVALPCIYISFKGRASNPNKA